MGLVRIPPPVPPRNDVERAVDAEFYRRQSTAPRRRAVDVSGFFGPLVLFAIAFLSGTP